MQYEDKKKIAIDCIMKVFEFADVFLEELKHLPPHREIDFSIEVYPCTNPISVAPYRTAPLELKELKIKSDNEKKMMDRYDYVWITGN